MKIFGRTLRYVALIIIVVIELPLIPASTVRAAQTDIIGPPGSGQFGQSVTVLPNGNIVITDPYYDAGAAADVGAVYLYDGATLALISTLTGSTADDRVGSGDVVVLSNGNYVVHSPDWDNGADLRGTQPHSARCTHGGTQHGHGRHRASGQFHDRRTD